MKIRSVDTQLCRVPLQQRTITDSQSRVDAVEFLQVVLETDAGITGYGMNWSYTPGLRAAQVAVVDNYAPLLVGRDPERKKQREKQPPAGDLYNRIGAQDRDAKIERGGDEKRFCNA